MHKKTSNDNSVNGVRSTSTSLGRDLHVRQVEPDRHPVTVRNNNNLRIGTWNVRTLFQAGKLANVKQEMDRLKINMLGLSETRWPGSGCLDLNGSKFVYSGGGKHERGVGVIIDQKISKRLLGYWAISDRVLMMRIKGKPFDISVIQLYAPTADSSEEEIDLFYEQLDEAKRQCKSQDVIIVMGDLNAKVGNEEIEQVTGRFGLGEMNERGERWASWCKANSQTIMNTRFKHHKRRLWTWRDPGGRIKNQIDFVTINHRFRKAVQNAKTYPGADCNSDHNPVVCNMKVRLRRLKEVSSEAKLQWNLLRENKEMKARYSVAVQNRFDVLESESVSKWEVLKEALVETSRELIPPTKRQQRKEWMNAEILSLMEERQKVKDRDSEQYCTLNREVRRKCRETKEEWINNQCAEIERCRTTDPSSLHKKVSTLIGKKTCTSSGCIKAKDGSLLMEKEELTERWAEYIEELFMDERGEKPIIQKPIEGPEILKSEVKAAINKMKKNKAAEPDNICIEMIQALDEFGIEKVTDLVNAIYDSGEIPPDMSKSIFIALPKKPGATECELHRTISLMSHITKVLMRVLMGRIRRISRPEIGREQFGFVQNAGTRNAIFILRMLSERAIEMQQDIYLCFIDYSKAFDKVKHETLLEMLQSLDMDGKDIRVLRNLYWEQTAAVRVQNQTGRYSNIKRGVRQGCVLSPDLFNLYSEQIMRTIKEESGFVIGGFNMNNIRYADDTTLIADTPQKLQKIVNIVKEESERKGLSINRKKTFCMVISKKNQINCCLKIDDEQIKQVTKFNYLGSMLTSDGRSVTEIRRRIAIAKESFERLSKILKCRTMSIDTRLRVLNCYVLPILMYGCESWIITPELEKKLKATEMWMLRRMLRISWTEHVSNEEVLGRANYNRRLLGILDRTRQQRRSSR